MKNNIFEVMYKIYIFFLDNKKWNLYINKEGARPSTRRAKELPNNYKRIVSIKSSQVPNKPKDLLHWLKIIVLIK